MNVVAARDDPMFTVAIPTCNGARHLSETIRSILAQTGVAFELIVCDDRSDDDTLAIVRSTAGDRARIEVNSDRLGLAGNWNQCTTLARTPFIAIFHQDDVMLPGHLAAHQAVLAADRLLGLTASGSTVIDEHGGRVSPAVIEPGGLGAHDQTLAPGQLAALMSRGNPLRCSAVALRVAALRQSGGFDPRLGYVVDWDAWLRLSRQWSVAWLARPSVQVRWHSASETHQFKTGLTDLDETEQILNTLFEIDLRNHEQRAQMHKAARERLARAYVSRAHEALRTGHPRLARDALKRGLRMSPGLVRRIIGDPKLGIEMITLALAPGLAARIFSPRRQEHENEG